MSLPPRPRPLPRPIPPPLGVPPPRPPPSDGRIRPVNIILLYKHLFKSRRRKEDCFLSIARPRKGVGSFSEMRQYKITATKVLNNTVKAKKPPVVSGYLAFERTPLILAKFYKLNSNTRLTLLFEKYIYIQKRA